MNPSIHPILHPLAAIALTLVAFPGPAAAAPPPRTLAITGKYLLLPVSNKDPRRSRLLVKVDDVLIHSLDVDFAPTPDAIDWWAYLDTAEHVGKTAELFTTADPAVIGLIRTGDTIPDLQPRYDEALRPQLRFSQLRGWNNDPNGMTWYDGEYHLFWQSNPAGWQWANMYWGHAVSKDLIHWEELPHAIRPQGGTLAPAKKHPAMIVAKAFSGSGNVDLLNTAGLQTGKEKPIVLVYTDYGGDGEGLAYSNDRGRTWKCYDKNPIIPATPELGGNDSKLVWYEPGKHWVLVHFMTRGFRGFTISTSPDLKTWTQTSRFPDFWECPELFEIPVDPAPSNISDGTGGDSSATRWILWGGDAKYMIGKFDGKTFTPESKGRKQLHWGNYYASQCFTNAPDKRVIQVGWTREIDMPGMPFNQAFSLPAELFLRSTASGLQLCAEPVRELETLRRPGPVTLAGKELNSSAAAVSFDVGGKGQLFDVLLSVRKGTAERVTLAFGGNALGYDFKEQELDGMPLPLKDGKFQIRLIIDRPLYEVFGTDGSCHKLSPRGEYAGKPVGKISVTADGGSATIESLVIYEMISIWKL
jgi:sucrose-6-phosphate hydrolase SacC (GH32 family)